MAIQTTTEKNSLATKYGTDATYAALYTTTPGASAGTEPTGAYARQPLTWGSASGGAITATATFNITSGTTIVGGGVHTALTAGTYLDGGALASQNFTADGTYTLTLTFTQV